VSKSRIQTAILTTFFLNFRAPVPTAFTGQGKIWHERVHQWHIDHNKFYLDRLIRSRNTAVFDRMFNFGAPVSIHFTDHEQIWQNWHRRADLWYIVPCQILPWSVCSVVPCGAKKGEKLTNFSNFGTHISISSWPIRSNLACQSRPKAYASMPNFIGISLLCRLWGKNPKCDHIFNCNILWWRLLAV